MLTGESLETLPLDLSPNGEVDFGLGILDWGFWIGDFGAGDFGAGDFGAGGD